VLATDRPPEARHPLAGDEDTRMPTYQYACSKCGDEFEVYQTFSDAPLKRHPDCGGSVQKVFAPVGIVLKGSGFYKTDSRSGSGSKSGSRSESSESKSDSNANSNSDSSSDSSSTTKSETKSETKKSEGASNGSGTKKGSGSSSGKPAKTSA
jgi:putative FmdB family regulatory protein